MTRIALILDAGTATPPTTMLHSAGLSADDLVELRLDTLSPEILQRAAEGVSAPIASLLAGLARSLRLPRGGIILTARRVADGGRYRGDESARLAILGRALEVAATSVADGQTPVFVDLECAPQTGEPLPGCVALASRARSLGAHVLWSVHSFAGVPREQALQRLRQEAEASPGNHLKLAAMIPGDAELERILEFRAGLPAGRHVVIGMGPKGRMTRELSGVLGNAWTYAHHHGVYAPAPGVPSVAELRDVARVHAQRTADAWLAVVGNPVGHSLSPEWHSTRLTQAGLRGFYTRLEPDSLDAVLPLIRGFGLLGLSVTVPFKQDAVRLADCATGDVRLAGAANTLVRIGDRLVAHNTDIAGFLAPLRERKFALAGKTALIIGAGGAARAAAVGLARQGVEVWIWNRTRSRAEELCLHMQEQTGAQLRVLGDLDAATESGADLVVQTTPVGLPSLPGDPAPDLRFRTGQLVYELNYRETAFLRRAQAAGADVLDGSAMFAAQAELQAELFLPLLADAQGR